MKKMKSIYCLQNHSNYCIFLASVVILAALIVSCPSNKHPRKRWKADKKGIAARLLARDSSNWTLIPAGRFLMGSPKDEAGRLGYRLYGRLESRKHDCEKQHKVTITRSFLLKKTEVTQGEFNAIMGYNPSRYPKIVFNRNELVKADFSIVLGKQYPADWVSWYEAVAFCNALSEATGLPSCYKCSGKGRNIRCSFAINRFKTPYDCPGYRLPTEAEWEYAARAGTTTETYNGDCTYQDKPCDEINDPVLEPIAWFCANSNGRTHKVGKKRPNGWGLYDMLGNVEEWCHDWFQDEKRISSRDPWGAEKGKRKVSRGGDYGSLGTYVRAADCQDVSPENHNSGQGFRPAKTVVVSENLSGGDVVPHKNSSGQEDEREKRESNSKE